VDAILGSVSEPKLTPNLNNIWNQLETSCAKSQGSERSGFTKFAKGVEKLLELELYFPEQREGLGFRKIACKLSKPLGGIPSRFD
jgi:hypothetical protein